MSRTPVDLAHPKRDFMPDEQAERLKYDDAPKHVGLPAIAERVNELFGVKVTTHYLRRATNSRKLAFNEICHKIHCSDRQLYDFIVLGTRKHKAS